MNIQQLTPSDQGVLARVLESATRAGARALGTLTGSTYEIGNSALSISSLAETVMMIEELPRHMTVVYVEVIGKITGQLVLMSSAASANVLVSNLLNGLESGGIDRAAIRRDTMGEVGNIVLSNYLNTIVDMTGLSAEPSTPMVAMDVSAAVLELPLARAASSTDAVVRFDATFMVEGSDQQPLRAPLQILFLPAPGGLSAMLDVLDDNRPRTQLRVPVRMGELAVSRRPGDLLVASALGSCVAVALVDRLAGVGAMAHVMMPEAPEKWRIYDRPTYAARYADAAIPALLNALERAGGRRVCTQAFITGGGQMFTGQLAETMDVPQRNVMAVKKALIDQRLPVAGDETGGTSSRSLELDIATMSVVAHIDGIRPVRLDAA